MIGRKDFFWPQSAESSDEELLRSVIEQFYNKEGQPPKEVLVPASLDDAPLIEQWLTEKRGEAVRVVVPERGQKHQLVRLAEENATAALTEHLRNEELDRQATQELKRLLRLENVSRPDRRSGYFEYHGQGVGRVVGGVGGRTGEKIGLSPVSHSDSRRRE